MMLRLEFIERRIIPWWGLACLVLSLAWGGTLLAESLALRAVAAEKVERAAQLDAALESRRRAALQQQAKTDPETQRRLKEQQKIVAALQYPWTRVLSTIEQADSNEVAVLSLSHEQAAGQTQIGLEALDAAALVRFVDALNDENSAGRQEGDRSQPAQWYLTNYQMQRQDSLQTVKGMVLNK